MGMCEFYGSTDDDMSKKVLLHALENGVTLLDTSDTYRDGHNENMKLVDRLKTIADSRNITLSQLALAWVLHRERISSPFREPEPAGT